MRTRSRIQESVATTFTIRSRFGLLDDVVMETAPGDDGCFHSRAYRVRQECADGLQFTRERGVSISIMDVQAHPEVNIRHAHFMASEVFLFGMDTDDEIRELFEP